MLKDFTQAIKDKLESEPRLHAVLIYGSQANSSASPSSDIDIAYLADYKNHVVVFLNNRKAYEQWKVSTLGMYHDLQITNRHIYKNLGKVS
jgi:predicted nucleotidyltransferase